MRKSNNGEVVYNIRTYEIGISHEQEITYPVTLNASYILGGWCRNATNQEEFRRFLKEGLYLSPVSEVKISWRV